MALLVVVSCGSPAPEAPAISATFEACAETFCATAPEGWDVVTEGDTLSYTHPLSEDASVFVSAIDMAWLLTSTGSAWPASLESVERSYWSLLDTPALVPDAVMVSGDGSSSRSRGTYEGRPRWHGIYPIEGGPIAIAVTAQLPSQGWESHAETFVFGVRLTP